MILPAIYERIKAKEYSAIVLDPIYCMYGDLDENSAGDVSDLMNSLRKLSNKSKAAIVFAHHLQGQSIWKGKPGQDLGVRRVGACSRYQRQHYRP